MKHHSCFFSLYPTFMPSWQYKGILKWMWMIASLQTDFSRGVYVGTFQLSKSTEKQLLVNAAATVLTAWMSPCSSAHWLPELTERDKLLPNPLQFSLKCLGSLERPLRLQSKHTTVCLLVVYCCCSQRVRGFGFNLVRNARVKPASLHLPGQWYLPSGNAFLPGFQPRCSAPTQSGEREREREGTSAIQRKKWTLSLKTTQPRISILCTRE